MCCTLHQGCMSFCLLFHASCCLQPVHIFTRGSGKGQFVSKSDLQRTCLGLHQRTGQTLVGCCCVAVACATLTSQSFCQTSGNWMLNSAFRKIQTTFVIFGIIFTMKWCCGLGPPANHTFDLRPQQCEILSQCLERTNVDTESIMIGPQRTDTFVGL